MVSLATSQIALLFLILSVALSLFTIISFDSSDASPNSIDPTSFQALSLNRSVSSSVIGSPASLLLFQDPKSRPKLKVNNNNDKTSVSKGNNNNDNSNHNNVSRAPPLPLSTSKWVKSVIQPYQDVDRYVYWKVNATDQRFLNLPNFQFCRWRNLERNPERHLMKPPLPMTNNKDNAGSKATTKTYLLHMEIDCEQVLKKSNYGTGNWVQSMYIMRHHAAVMIEWDTFSDMPQVDLLLTCPDAAVGASKEVLPWLMGYYPLPAAPNQKKQHKNKKQSDCPSDGSWGHFPIVGIFPLLRMELRRMAVSLVGLPHNDPDHPAHAFVKSIQEQQQQQQQKQQYQLSVGADKPFLPNVELDQVAIHFRCGDIMLANHIQFRFIKFNAIVNRIDKQTKSIGIVTQPFDTKPDSQARDKDLDDPHRMETCQTVTYAFVDRLKERFPHARISIRNGPEETVGLAYARLIMAKQAFAAPDSSFSVFPTLATFGIGYHIQPSKKEHPYFKNRFLLKVGRNDPQVVFMNERNVLSPRATKVLFNKTGGATAIVEWFQNDSIPAPGMV